MRFFIPNDDFEGDLMADETFRGNLAKLADGVRAEAESVAVRIMPRQSQAFEVEEDEDGVRVVNTDYGGAIAEWGSINNAPYAPLRRGAAAAGLRVVEQPKP